MSERAAAPGPTTAPAGPRWRVEVIERVPPAGGMRPAIAVGLAVAVLVWVALAESSLVGWRYFLTSAAAVLSAAVVLALSLNRRRPDRAAVRAAELPLRMSADASGLHLSEDRGAHESLRWSDPHAIAVWTDAEGAPLLLRVATRQVQWSILGPFAGTVPRGLPTIRLSRAAAARSTPEALARRHAPWELVLRPIGSPELIGLVCQARPSDRDSAPLWRIPLDAEWDPTARWSLRLRPGGVLMERAGDEVESIDLAADFEVDVSSIAGAVRPDLPLRPLRRFDLRQGRSRVRFAIEPETLDDDEGPSPPASPPPSDQPRLVAAEWAELVLAHIGLDARGLEVPGEVRYGTSGVSGGPAGGDRPGRDAERSARTNADPGPRPGALGPAQKQLRYSGADPSRLTASR